MTSFSRFIKYPTAMGRIAIIIINNIYCIPTYVIWMIILTPLKHISSKIFYKIEGLLFHWMLAVVTMWSYSAGYQIVETGDNILECLDKKTLVIVNHQSTADVPLLMANFNSKRSVLPNIMWIMDRLFKYTNFGIVSLIHEDFFISSGRSHREAAILALRDHMKHSYMKSGKKWIVLFPEGGFLRKRKEISKKFAIKNNLPILEHVTIPRVGAFQAVLDTLRPQHSIHCSKPFQSTNSTLASNTNLPMLEYVLDITIAYPDQNPLNLLTILHGLRKPCTTYMFYRMYEVKNLPTSEKALTQWLYDRFTEKNVLLENFYKYGSFNLDESFNRRHIQQDVLRFALINLFFILSSYFHFRLILKCYTECVCFMNNVST